MKTKTRSYLVELINKKGSLRPSNLSRELTLTPQAIHRHLKALVNAGIIEARGHSPFTRYVIANMPDFQKMFTWYTMKGSVPKSDYFCETRDVFSARLSQLFQLEEKGLTEKALPLIVSVVGEIGNNSFDHNLGHWQDIPGCWFQTQFTRKRFWVIVADKGQGIYRSLLRVDPRLQSDQKAIEKAFREHLSGRAPEQRGNGLKYVASVINKYENSGLACRSGKGEIAIGEQGNSCSDVLGSDSLARQGTLTVMTWGLS